MKNKLVLYNYNRENLLKIADLISGNQSGTKWSLTTILYRNGYVRHYKLVIEVKEA